MLYIVVILFSSGIIASIIKSCKKNRKINSLSEREMIIIKERVSKMSGRDFEVFSEKIYRLIGYKTLLTPLTNDKGRDIIMNRNNEKVYVECKNYKNKSGVGRPEAQKLCGAMVANNISKGIILTYNGANKNCIEYCKQIRGKQVKIDSIEVINIIDLLEQCSSVDANEILGILGMQRIE